MAVNVETSLLGAQKYALAGAILLYRTNGANADTYATFHSIERQRKGGAQIGPGVPATADACAEFARGITDRAAFAGFLSPHLLYIGPRVVSWWRAPAPARVWFECQPHKDKARDIGTRSAVTPHPGLVFTLADGRWLVHAVRGEARPGPGTPLYVAPYFNVDEHGLICEGNVERPARVTPESIAKFEQAFFESRFTHPNIHRASQFARFKGGPYAFWKSMLDAADAGAAPPFPEHCLVSGKTTLAGLIKKLEDRKHEPA